MDRFQSSSAAVARWGARILGGMLLLFWGFFLIAHAVGDQGRSSQPLTGNDYLILASLAVSLAGLAIAWKWERGGAIITLVSTALCAAANWKVLLFPGSLIPIVAVCFLMSWWLRRPPQSRREVQRSAP